MGNNQLFFTQLRLTIKNKLIGYTMGVFLMLLSVIAFNQWVKIRVEKLSFTERQFQELSESILKLRWYEQKFLTEDLVKPQFYRFGLTESLLNFDSLLSSSKSSIRDMQSSASNELLAYHNSLIQLSKDLEAYRDVFDKLRQAEKDRGFKDFGLIGKMRENVHNLETALSRDDLQVLILTLRRHEKDYLLRLDDKYQSKLQETAGRLRSKIG
ncbi:MAG: hypothetical protein AAFO69_09840, partial [Bacteroidota bacterium]